MLDYFDAFLVGLTATPDKRTFAFFEENVVSEYSREQAIIDGVNVGEDMYHKKVFGLSSSIEYFIKSNFSLLFL